jgi:hypothetical protein
VVKCSRAEARWRFVDVRAVAAWLASVRLVGVGRLRWLAGTGASPAAVPFAGRHPCRVEVAVMRQVLSWILVERLSELGHKGPLSSDTEVAPDWHSAESVPQRDCPATCISPRADLASELIAESCCVGDAAPRQRVDGIDVLWSAIGRSNRRRLNPS